MFPTFYIENRKFMNLLLLLKALIMLTVCFVSEGILLSIKYSINVLN